MNITDKKMVMALISLSVFSCAACVALIGGSANAADAKNVLVIGHRGASGYAPENTMVSYKMAYDMGADMIELDIYMSKDGVPVIMHDNKVERTTDGDGDIQQMTLEQIKKLDAGSKFNKKFAGEQVPTLEEVFAWASGKIPVNVEIKGEGCEKKLVELIKKYKMEKSVIVSSFNHEYIKKVRKLAPEITIAALVGKVDDLKALVNYCHPDAVNPSFNNVTKKLVDEAHAMGLKVYTYTVNDQLSMKQMIAAGVDGIFTNYSDVLLKLLKRQKKEEKKG